MSVDRLFVTIAICGIMALAGCKKEDATPKTTAPNTDNPAPVEVQTTEAPRGASEPLNGARTNTNNPTIAGDNNNRVGGARPVEDFAAKVEKEITAENYKEALDDIEKTISELESQVNGENQAESKPEPPSTQNNEPTADEGANPPPE